MNSDSPLSRNLAFELKIVVWHLQHPPTAAVLKAMCLTIARDDLPVMNLLNISVWYRLEKTIK